ncbi:mannose-P-dolichol utilization defect 1 protein homolog [Neodiprion pinetum]|uniref:Mannose-P-dolichol utilization defect 1 protein homolog n=1 Tax=Neodiprion lecontei TaxID=441921 RepID=A0A6J0CBD4_NEOLC|nr:mannose-P-dolichol utilization defect 1 protein homolog [Neodiprion lecontei]XP_046470710.1 mannose-P-dolichol utilization defect 1 protein homolog [Neodiprion pinetum]
MAEAFKSAALVLFTEKCFEEYFEDLNFFDPECFKSTLSRGLGIGIIAGSFLVKLPQIVKISNNKSGQGINIFSVLLDLFAITATVAYSFVNGFPFSSWGDGVSLGLQTAAIGALVMHYNGATQQAVAFVIGYLAIVYALTSGLTSVNILWSMQAVNVPILLTSKVIQAYTNYRNGNTGQLSAATSFMLFFGSLARIFTSVQETGDSILILTYVCSTAANALILSQVLYYWNAIIKPATKKSKKTK